MQHTVTKCNKNTPHCSSSELGQCGLGIIFKKLLGDELKWRWKNVTRKGKAGTFQTGHQPSGNGLVVFREEQGEECSCRGEWMR